jgi:hypothetical protein
VKIEALEKRISTLEAQIATMSKEMHALYQVNVKYTVDPKQP